MHRNAAKPTRAKHPEWQQLRGDHRQKEKPRQEGLRPTQEADRHERLLAEDEERKSRGTGQRNHPQERRRRDIGRQMRRERDEQSGRHERQRNPAQPRLECRRGVDAAAIAAPPVAVPSSRHHQSAATEDGRRRARGSRRPQVRLTDKAEQRLGHDRIGEQRGQRCRGCSRHRGNRDRRRGDGPVRAEPGLQQRGIGGNRKERQADAGTEQHADQPEVGLALGGSHRPKRAAATGSARHAAPIDELDAREPSAPATERLSRWA